MRRANPYPVIAATVGYLSRVDGPPGTVPAFTFQVDGAPDQGTLDRAVGCAPLTGEPQCRLAFLVDGVVLTAPTILRTLTADKAVFANFAAVDQARLLAAQLGPRELPPGVKVAG